MRRSAVTSLGNAASSPKWSPMSVVCATQTEKCQRGRGSGQTSSNTTIVSGAAPKAEIPAKAASNLSGENRL